MATIDANLDLNAIPGWRQRLSQLVRWIGGKRSIRALEVGSIFAFIGIALMTGAFLTSQGDQSEPLAPASAAALLVANLVPATTLLVLFGRRLALRRSEMASVGSKELLHVRLVAIFSLIAAIPTMLLVIFASLLFQSGVQFWFSGSARDMLSNAGALARGYYDEKLRDVADETATMAGDIRYSLNQTRPDNPEFLDAYFQQVLNRKLSESAIVVIGPDGIQQTSAVVSPDDKRKVEWISKEDLLKLASGENLLVSVKPDRIEAITVLFDNPKSYLYASRTMSVPSFELGTKAQSVLQDYDAMVARSRSLQVQFNVALYLVSLLIIGITVWIALLVADRLVRPVNNLVKTAQKIADGDLSARVAENPDRNDEVGFLSETFNLMTERLESQTSTLLTANRQLDDRRAFIEAVLESVSAGIVSLDGNGTIRLSNSTAEKLLGTDSGDSIIGQNLADVSPVFSDLIARKQLQAVVQIGETAEPQTVAVKISTREGGHVVTFEDISQQLADQRRAAWSDVARRIAHEIKNPLTPIQLAAERLQRRFGKQVQDGLPIFEQLTSTIIRQVGDLRNIVDEFSSFARMPKPVLRQESLDDIVGHAVFLMEVAHSSINFEFRKPKSLPQLVCDRRQLGQAITNILKNAAEAIHEKEHSDDVFDDYKGKITIDIAEIDQQVTLRICDNGPGLPKDRDRILEPYVTSRATGSGLGLAIVKKIVEEHFASIAFSDAEGGGARVTIIFPAETLASLAASPFKNMESTPFQNNEKDHG